MSGRALVVESPRRAAVVAAAAADPGPGEVRVRLDGCGVCGSNLPVWTGRPWFAYPLAPGAPGHEGWGEVDAVGDGVRELSVGTRVATIGGDAFASHVTVAQDAVVPLPFGLDGDFPGEAVGAACNVAARSGFAPGTTVAVVGVGFIGAIVTALAARAGAEVVALSRRPHPLEVARLLGAARTSTLTEPDEAVRRLGTFDVVVECVGEQPALDLADALTTTRGRLVIAGFHQDGARTVDLQSWNWRGIDVVNAHERDLAIVADGVRRGAELVAAGELDLAPLLTHRFPLERGGQALDAMVERPGGFMKALVLT